MTEEEKAAYRLEGRQAAVSVLDKTIDDFWDSFEENQKQCDHKNMFFGSGAFFVICNDCKQCWKAVTKFGDGAEDYAETTKDMTGQQAKSL